MPQEHPVDDKDQVRDSLEEPSGRALASLCGVGVAVVTDIIIHSKFSVHGRMVPVVYGIAVLVGLWIGAWVNGLKAKHGWGVLLAVGFFLFALIFPTPPGSDAEPPF